MSDNKDNSHEIIVSDEQLDDWLAQVDVPTGLHNDLLKIAANMESIAEEDNEWVQTEIASAQLAVESSSKAPSPYDARSYGNRWTALAVAVCYLILAGSVWLFWPTDQVVNQWAQSDLDAGRGNKGDLEAEKDKQITGSSQQLRSNEAKKEVSDSPAFASSNGLLDSFDALDTIDEKLNEMRIRKLEEQLARIEQDSLRLETRESASIVLAIADQTPIHLGASRESIQSDMTKVVAEFPDSRGAAIASQQIYQPNW